MENLLSKWVRSSNRISICAGVFEKTEPFSFLLLLPFAQILTFFPSYILKIQPCATFFPKFEESSSAEANSRSSGVQLLLLSFLSFSFNLLL